MRRMSAPTTSVATLFALLPALGLGQAPVINEIYYEPPDKNVPEEFVELYNPGPTAIDLSRWRFADGITFTFPEGTLIGAGAYLVVAEDPETLRASFGSSIPVLGPFVGQLDNDGEQIVLVNQAGDVVDEVDYKLGFPWPLASSGDGPSIELINPSLPNDVGGSWRAAGTAGTGGSTRRYFVEAADAAWHYRKGTSEPPAT